jgi:hypothetical protein
MFWLLQKPLLLLRASHAPTFTTPTSDAVVGAQQPCSSDSHTPTNGQQQQQQEFVGIQQGRQQQEQ